MDLARQMFLESSILDIETLSLREGSGIYSVSMFDAGTNTVKEYFVDPNYVQVQNPPKGDSVKARDREAGYRLYEPKTWEEVRRRAAELEAGQEMPAGISLEAFEEQHSPFFARQLRTTPFIFSGQNPAERLEAFRREGITYQQERTSVRDLVTKHLHDNLTGKTIWIQNTQFENMQLGAVMKGVLAEGGTIPFLAALENRSQDRTRPMDVTGLEVMRAKVVASRTGDWRGVWRAIKSDRPKPGETRVRDIMDLGRSFLSYEMSEGLLPKSKPSFGNSIDVLYRIMKMAEGVEAAKIEAETHLSAEDAAKHESYVLNKLLHYNELMERIQNTNDAGERARLKKTALYEEVQEHARIVGGQLRVLREHAARQQLERAYTTLIEQGQYTVTAGARDPWTAQHVTPSGDVIGVPVQAWDKRVITSMDQIVDHLAQDPDWRSAGVDVGSTWERMREGIVAVPGEEKASLKAIMETSRQAIWDSMNVKTVRRQHMGTGVGATLSHGPMSGYGKAMLLTTALVGTIFWGSTHGQSREGRNYLVSDYEEWSRMNATHEAGVAGETRRFNTDFGSPYVGPITSSSVFIDQELMRERETMLRERYGAQHYDPDYGLFGFFGPFKNFGRPGYQYMRMGEGTNHPGLNGPVRKVDLRDGYKIEVEDADTIVVRRGGLRGALMSAFGMNRGNTFRLEGIDAPEVSHGETGYHAPQPGGEAAKAAVQEMLRSGSLELYYKPNETTYGRHVGVLFQDGKNTNVEIIRRGYAAALPYGKAEDAMISHQVVRAAEKPVVEAQRGIWGNPWEQVFAAATEGRERITFNTFTRASRLAENPTQASLLALMEDSQARGEVTAMARAEASMLGENMEARRYKGELRQSNWFSRPSMASTTIQRQLAWETQQFMDRKGGRGASNKFSSRGGYGSLDSSMSLDSMRTSNQAWGKPKGWALQNDEEQRQRQAALQRSVNGTMFRSGVGHTYMGS